MDIMAYRPTCDICLYLLFSISNQKNKKIKNIYNQSYKQVDEPKTETKTVSIFMTVSTYYNRLYKHVDEPKTETKTVSIFMTVSIF